MTTTDKRPDPRIIAGVVFLCAGAPFLALSPGVGIALLGAGLALTAGGVVATRKKARLNGNGSQSSAPGMPGVPYRVAAGLNGEVVVSLPCPMADTFQTRLAEYGFQSSSSEQAPGVVLLNFGSGADVVAIQRVIDSFTIPPLPVILG